MAFSLCLFTILLLRKVKFSHQIIWLLDCRGVFFFLINAVLLFIYAAESAVYTHTDLIFCLKSSLSIFQQSSKTLSSCGGLFWHHRVYCIFLWEHHFNCKIAVTECSHFVLRLVSNLQISMYTPCRAKSVLKHQIVSKGHVIINLKDSNYSNAHTLWQDVLEVMVGSHLSEGGWNSAEGASQLIRLNSKWILRYHCSWIHWLRSETSPECTITATWLPCSNCATCTYTMLSD